MPSSMQSAASTTWGTTIDIGTSCTLTLSSALPRKTDPSTAKNAASVASEMNSAMRPSTRNNGNRIPANRHAAMISHLLANPLKGGTPAMLNEAIAVVPVVYGMKPAKPPSLSMSRLPVR